jgi:hypothetical protein
LLKPAEAKLAGPGPALPFLYALASFVSAGLLFLIEPLFGKMVLPLLGGSPAVWNTCMLFFQAVLLAGYGYAHLTTRWLGVRRQAVVHLAVVLLPFLVLPITVAGGRLPPENANPIPWLLGVLCLSVGLPFFVVSTSGPLLQRWFAGSRHPAARDPYFLYAAGNLGSLLALFSYPFLLEPLLALPAHARLWRAGYAVLVLLIGACAWSVWRWKQPGEETGTGTGQSLAELTSASGWPKPVPISSPLTTHHSSLTIVHSPLTTHQRLLWVILAFVPSSLMLSVTTYLTADIAAIPLLWVIPLALYLLSFVLVFARKPLVRQAWLVRILALGVLILALAMLAEATEPIWLLMPLHLGVFFVVALVCHGELARRRPGVEHLTEYYWWLGVGGVMGGVFNALVAPVIFPTVVEYPLVLVLACLLRGWMGSEKTGRGAGEKTGTGTGQSSAETKSGWKWPEPVPVFSWDLAFAAGLGLLGVALIFAVPAVGIKWPALRQGLIFGLPLVLCYTAMERPVRFGLGLGALFLAGTLYQGSYGSTLLRARSFFGVHRVTLDRTRNEHLLVHGNTIHGRQSLTEELRREPMTYYHRTGPIGRLFVKFSTGPLFKQRIGIVGLGAGSLAALGQPGQEITFYEIDPLVERIARDERYFTFLRDSPAQVEVILGDARLKLQQEEGLYDLLVIDAFTSDAIPLHLLTRQALQLYVSKLAPGGLLAFNVSNRYLDLEPVLGNLAGDAGLLAWAGNEIKLTRQEREQGKSESYWMLMARSQSDLGPLAISALWEPIPADPHGAIWTDDFSNLLSVFRFGSLTTGD